MMLNKPLAQNLDELSHITKTEFSLTFWTGAVNMVFVEDAVLFIKRSSNMPTHKGQVGFLGGHKLEADLSPKMTAFRELTEESGIESTEFKFLGLSDPVMTVNNQTLIPVVSKYIGSRKELIKKIVSNGEWTHFLLIESSHLQKASNWQYARARVNRDQSSHILFFPLLFSYGDYFPMPKDNRPYVLWGATAKMIWNFFKNNS